MKNFICMFFQLKQEIRTCFLIESVHYELAQYSDRAKINYLSLGDAFRTLNKKKDYFKLVVMLGENGYFGEGRHPENV